MADPIPLMELRQHHCRFIVDETPGPASTLYCGAPAVPGSSWCPTHHRLCVVAVVPRPVAARGMYAGLRRKEHA